jgi:uncharacterized phage protein (TIGR02218 family)
MSGAAALHAHLATGVTTTCRAWGLTRTDGVRLGFTDHDRDLAFEGWTFRAGTGLTSGTLSRKTGLSVDNVEAMGALSDAAIREADIVAGRYDGAKIVCWLVNWEDVAQRVVVFSGSLGEITRSDGAFRADLRGLSEPLGAPQGRAYQRICGASLGDASCGVDMSAPGRSATVAVAEAFGDQRFRFSGVSGFAPDWFARGRFVVESGAASGLVGMIKADRTVAGGLREVTLWQGLRAEVVPGDAVRLQAGCDKRLSTCRDKFANTLNFQGFPFIPGDDWLTTYPKRSGRNDGGRLEPPVQP